MKNDSGRSMVEMLAVLAIMAVLSITGIYAYNLAIIKHQVNEIMHSANIGYMEVMSKDVMPNWTDLKVEQLDGTAMQGMKFNNAGFVKITGIDKDVCNRLIADGIDGDLITSADTIFDTCTDNNEIVFDFAGGNTLGLSCESSADCDESAGQYCSTNSEICINKTDCDTTSSKPQWDYEIDNCNICPGGLSAYWDGSSCAICDTNTPYYTGSTCSSCEDNNPDTPYWTGAECTACPSDIPYWNSVAKICDVCAPTDVLVDGVCTSVASLCTAGYTITGAEDGLTYCVSSGAMNLTNARIWCNARNMGTLSREVACPNIPAYGGVCTNLAGLRYSLKYIWLDTVYSGAYYYLVYMSGAGVYYNYYTSYVDNNPGIGQAGGNETIHAFCR